MRKKFLQRVGNLSMFLCLLGFSHATFAQQEKDSVLNLDLATALKIAHDNNHTIKIAELEIQRVD